jgi:hypothetical protein
MNAVIAYAKSLPPETIYFGGPKKPANRLSLQAGNLTMIYENGSLRSVAIGKYEIVRMIYAAVRDKVWLTAEPEISDEMIDIQENRFQISYNCRYRLDEIDFAAVFKITGESDDSVTFEMEGEALNKFEKSRIGFCLLHPVEECAGNQCFITHPDGKNEISFFPLNISPYQPFKDIISMEWKVLDYKCKVDFIGDIFETEDHRNWTDASYKTYCTPLEIPFPVTLKKGERINQKIVLKVVIDNFQVCEKLPGKHITLFPHQLKPLPEFGVGHSTRPQKMSRDEIATLKNLQFDHYRIDLYLFNDDWKLKGQEAVDEAVLLGYPVLFALFLDEHYHSQASEFFNWISGFKVITDRIVLFHKKLQSTPDVLTDAIIPLIKAKFPGIKVGCGTNANFAQLNRNRPESNKADFISYAIHPQEHATDNQSLVENLQAQGYTVESAMQFAHGKEVWVSPVNLQRRFNANLENFEHPFIGKMVPPQVDERLMSLFGAGWSAISLKYLSESGVSGCTYFETVGERGLFQGDYNSRWPKDFSSVAGMIFPIYHLFRQFLKSKGFRVMKSQSSDPLLFDSFTITNGECVKLIIVNFTAALQDVEIVGCHGDLRLKRLDIETYASAAGNPEWFDETLVQIVKPGNLLFLSPFSVCFIDGYLKL